MKHSFTLYSITQHTFRQNMFNYIRLDVAKQAKIFELFSYFTANADLCFTDLNKSHLHFNEAPLRTFINATWFEQTN